MLKYTDFDHSTASVQRLRFFLKCIIPIGFIAVFVVTPLAAIFNVPALFLIALEVALVTALLIWARNLLNRGKVQQAVLTICSSLWFMSVTGTLIAPRILAATVVLTIWPVMIALAYVTRKVLFRIIIVSIIVTVIISLASLQPGLMPNDALPGTVHYATLALFVALLAISLYMIIWHYGSRLGETLEQLRFANRALSDSEQSLEQKVVERTHQLEEMRDQAIEANRAKSSFLANMSHELRTPLNAIIGYSEMLQEEMEDVGQDELVPDLQKIQAAGKHLLSLINDILDLSKIEAGKMELYLENFDLNALLQEVVTTIEPLIEKKHNRLELEISENLGTMRADATKVRQSLFNLLSNAAKFTENGVIRLKVAQEQRRDEAWFRFEVADSGIGMTSEQLDKLFQAFQQADASTTRKYGGTGLGLAITRHFCQMMNGDVSVNSELEKGSTFVIELPRNVETPNAPRVGEKDNKLEIAAHVGTVLVIDDDTNVQDLLYRFLSKEGFRVEVAGSGEEGLHKCQELRPDVVTLDVMMPGSDGWTVLSQLKSNPQTSNIPVIMLTMVDERNLGYALGAADYLVKPFQRDQLLSVVRKYQQQDNDFDILIVEDNADIRRLTKHLLQSRSWQVREAENGRVALRQLEKRPPQLILLDLMMPEMDGFEFVIELRKHAEWRTIPIIVVTAKEVTAADSERLNGYVERVIQKGAYTREELLSEVRELALRSTLEKTLAKI